MRLANDILLVRKLHTKIQSWFPHFYHVSISHMEKMDSFLSQFPVKQNGHQSTPKPFVHIFPVLPKEITLTFVNSHIKKRHLSEKPFKWRYRKCIHSLPYQLLCAN